ncbi:hypothetical protein RHSIM_Rhsim03G0118200 [Rhododendron simsii]|uniref:Uncharacterized protein n=1 Tax=Rhododendron simsii TaxID=118357 RepID=A0A834H3P7_RHOSS|nr:hypothetical protein RHSIM_Rhsim03G0118200 [Rhododendron simsii]
MLLLLPAPRDASKALSVEAAILGGVSSICVLRLARRTSTVGGSSSQPNLPEIELETPSDTGNDAFAIRAGAALRFYQHEGKREAACVEAVPRLRAIDTRLSSPEGACLGRVSSLQVLRAEAMVCRNALQGDSTVDSDLGEDEVELELRSLPQLFRSLDLRSSNQLHLHCGEEGDGKLVRGGGQLREEMRRSGRDRGRR